MKNPIPVIIILVATAFFIIELAKESSWEVKADTPLYHEVDAPYSIERNIAYPPLGTRRTKSKGMVQPCPTLGVVSHTLFFMGM